MTNFAFIPSRWKGFQPALLQAERYVYEAPDYCAMLCRKSLEQWVRWLYEHDPDQTLSYYKDRWQIETLFKGMKSSGFNIEDTHVTALDRLEKLILLTMAAFVWCYSAGDYIDRKIKPITIKKHGRRARSVFKYGLDYIAECLLSGRNKLDVNLIQVLSCT